MDQKKKNYGIVEEQWAAKQYHQTCKGQNCSSGKLAVHTPIVDYQKIQNQRN